MAQIVKGDNCLDAWKSAAEFLISSKGSHNNLIIEIKDPSLFADDWLSKYNPSIIKPSIGNKNDINNVANTIFPYKLFEKCKTSEDFYEKYKQINERGKRRKINKSTWGTYFERLTYFNSDLNQLETIIQKLNTWTTQQSSAFVIHLSSPHLDKPQKMGAPCWQYAQLFEANKTLDLTVVYRNHDYFKKAFGNFLGLSKLLSYICTRTNRTPGKLICHSVHAYYSESNILMKRLIYGV